MATQRYEELKRRAKNHIEHLMRVYNYKGGEICEQTKIFFPELRKDTIFNLFLDVEQEYISAVDNFKGLN